MNYSFKNIINVLLPLAYIPYVVICIYNNPNADDFVYGHIALTKYFPAAWWEQYMTWTGRYSANVFVLLGPLKWQSFTLYKLFPLLLIFFTWFSVYFLQKNLFQKVLDRKEGVIITHGVVLLFIFNMPILSEGLYWYTGAVTYLLGCIFFTCYVGSLIRFYQGKWIGKNQFVHIFILTVFLLFCMGFNEVLMLLIVVFNLVVCIVVLIYKLKCQKITFYLLCITMLGVALVFMAPGNSVRINQFHHNHQFWYSVGFSLVQTIRFFALFVLSPPLWILSYAWIFIHKKLVKTVPIFQTGFYLHRYVSLMLLPLVIFICVFPAYWATGILGQHRTLNVAYWFFIFAWFINLSVWNIHLQKRISNVQIPKTKTILLLFVITVTCFAGVKNGFYCSMDVLTGRAAHFDSQMKKRYASMQSINDTIEFTPVQNIPKSICFYEVTNDSNNWLNACWVSYFGKEGKAIVVKKQTAE